MYRRVDYDHNARQFSTTQALSQLRPVDENEPKDDVSVTEIQSDDFSYTASDHKNRQRLYRTQSLWRHRIFQCLSRSNSSVGPDATKYWKPVTLGVPLLGTFIIISLGLAAVIEVLTRISDRDNGLAFGATASDIPFIYTFLYQFFPTIIAVIYSMFWSWVDLDVKRLEPWFQLSKDEGALAENSLLLHYPFDFLAFVPLNAAKWKHWSVVFGGINMMLIFWAITPLQSAIFGTGLVTRSTSLSTVVTKELLPIDQQLNALNANFMNSAYSILWLDQAVPAFTTSDYAILPYNNTDTKHLEDPTISQIQGNTTSYHTELQCWPANYTQGLNGYTFDNGKGCSVPQIALPNSQFGNNFTMLYVGYYGSPNVDYQLQNPNCSEEAAHQFLAVWGFGTHPGAAGVFQNVTAAFCEPRYFKQNVTASVNVMDLSVNSTTPVSQHQNISQSEFNITNFEWILGTGLNTMSSEPEDYPDTVVLEQFPRLMDMGLIWPVTNMVGFALGGQNLSLDAYADIDTIETAFDAAHKLLFSLAVNTMLQDSQTAVESPGFLLTSGTAILANRIFAIVVESVLVSVALLAFALLFISARRPSRLVKDPSNIIDIIDLIRGSKQLLDRFRDISLLDDEALQQELSKEWFRLSSGTSSQVPILEIIESSRHVEEGGNSLRHLSHQAGYYAAIRPRELSLAIAIPFIGAIIGAIVVLIYFWEKNKELHGLPRPTSNFLILQILENYLPMAFSTLLEPFWVVLNRLLCIFQPFEDLRIGKARSSQTIRAKYTSLPPQLVIWRALRAHHFLLAAVCCIAMSANVLAVGLGALFFEDVVEVPLSDQFQYGTSSIFNGTPITEFGNTGPVITYSDHFYVAMSNLSEGTALPPWISPRFFFIPFESPTLPDQINATSSTAITRGFGAKVTCSTITAKTFNTSVAFSVSDDSLQFSTSVMKSDGSRITCVDYAQANGPNETTIFVNPPPADRSAFEIMTAMAPLGHGTTIATSDDGYCNSTLVAGWARLSASPNGTSTTQDRNLTSTFLSCVPGLQSALFQVTVSPGGRVLSYNQTTPFDTDNSQFLTGNGSVIDLFTQATQLIGSPAKDLTWHNDTGTRDWMNFLLGVVTESTAVVQPEADVPNGAEIAPKMEDLYERLFAILLGLNQHVFAPVNTTARSSANPLTVQGTTILPQPRILISSPMFYLTIVLLGLNVVVAVLYYVLRPPKFLPRMPTTIASLVAFVAASRAVEDQEKVENEMTYAFGRYVGIDGKTHIGIERHQLVVPLESRNPEVRRRIGFGLRRRDAADIKYWI